MRGEIELPLASGFTIKTSDDGKSTALLFRLRKTETLGIALRNAELNRMASLLISQAAKVASEVIPKQPPPTLTGTPILASHMGVAPGRSPTEALVSFRVGNLDFCFAVDASMLRQQAQYVLSHTSVTAPRKKQ